MLRIDFCTNIINNDTSKVDVCIIIKNLTKKPIRYLADKGYVANPQAIFRIKDSIVSDTLYFDLYHPNYNQDDYDRCFGCSADSIPVFTYYKYEILQLKKRKSNKIKLVLTKEQYVRIKHVKISIYSSYVAKKKNNPFEKMIYIISKPIDCENICGASSNINPK
jgi:hypothetical protein